ncbi:MAG: hypothetical protein GTO51_07915 [Candidatus Latescibacteria bacterium]|nr:hypothetical protein [Candidatus Latescibacterota bacterium]NIM21759.1 hypothetical protein [Candidatus Latescibacterota bacterium]NIM65897.1 hypothetical protein [Candidatus Latescibacterota bacterium]NIO02642.1 hypothetical protein [Candidatus Latescibacterota bacterium]NIO29623.1 hypothetical protein [Candidatus Latescibacterota bacterium]
MATVHYEIIIKGDQNLLCAYLHGFLRGRKIKEGVIFSTECPLRTHHLREMIHYKGEVTHLICRGSVRPAMISAIKTAPEDYSFEIKKEQRITGASFTFKFETFSKKVGSALKRTFTRIPEGVRLNKYKPIEAVLPRAAGIEGYAPMHDYSFQGTGEVSGDVETVLLFHQRLAQNQFIELEDISLLY